MTSPGRIDATALLRAGGLRVTRPRIAVLEVLHANPHPRADRIADEARSRLGSVSTQAVYDVLHACMRAGLVRSIEPAGSPSVFEIESGDNHHHAVCRTCGRIVDVGCAIGIAPCLTSSGDAGYALDEAEVVFWGLCPDCQPNRGPSSSDLGS